MTNTSVLIYCLINHNWEKKTPPAIDLWKNIPLPLLYDIMLPQMLLKQQPAHYISFIAQPCLTWCNGCLETTIPLSPVNCSWHFGSSCCFDNSDSLQGRFSALEHIDHPAHVRACHEKLCSMDPDCLQFVFLCQLRPLYQHITHEWSKRSVIYLTRWCWMLDSENLNIADRPVNSGRCRLERSSAL